MSADTTKSLNLSEFLPYRLSVLSNTISAQFASTYRERFDLSTPEWRLMAIVGRYPGITATQISQRAALDKVAVSRAAASLNQKSLVIRAASQTDGRSSKLELTEKGRDIYNQVVPLAEDFETNLLNHLSQGEQAELNALLQRLAEAISPDEALW